MWSAGCQHYGLVRNADGERVLPVLVRGQIHCTDAVLESATCAAPAEGGAERSSRLELNLAPSGPASADEGVPAALGATHSTDWSPANDGPGGEFRKTTRMSCVPLSFLSRAIARPSSPCPAPSWESGTSTLCPVLLALAVVCGADVCGRDCSRQLRSIVLRRVVWRCTGTPSLYAATCMGSIRQASASATGDASAGDGERANGSLQRTAGSGEQQSALGPLLKKFPPPGAEYVPPSEVPAMRWAYDTKVAL